MATKLVPFDSQGGRLWINIEMNGIYFISYVYQLWAAKTGEPPILTNPIKSGNNDIPHDDHYQVVNDYNPTQPISEYIDRVIDVRFLIKKGDDDNGYSVNVIVLQGDVYETAIEIGRDSLPSQPPGTVGSSTIKQEFSTIKLVKK